LFDVKKRRATFTEKQTKTFFGEATSKRGLYDLCGRKFVGKSRTKAFREVWKIRAKILCTPKNLPAPTLMRPGRPVATGAFGVLSPTNKAPSPPN